MFGLRLVSLAVVALLFGNGTAAPTPEYKPKFGEIVQVAPEHTSGGSVGTGGSIPHPHIALGNDHNGDAVVAPVTHNSHSDHLKPHMQSPNEHGLGGVVRLDHIVANRHAVSRSGGNLRGKVLSQHAVQRIQGGKTLVHAHRSASHAHGLAAQTHRGHEAFHGAESAHHFQTGNAQLGAHHASQAALHRGHAEAHEAAARNHHNAAQAVNGPGRHGELHHAQESAKSAHAVHQAFGAAAQHEHSGQASHAQGNHAASQASFAAADASHHEALGHSATAVHHANRATGHSH